MREGYEEQEIPIPVDFEVALKARIDVEDQAAARRRNRAPDRRQNPPAPISPDERLRIREVLAGPGTEKRRVAATPIRAFTSEPGRLAIWLPVAAALLLLALGGWWAIRYVERVAEEAATAKESGAPGTPREPARPVTPESGGTEAPSPDPETQPPDESELARSPVPPPDPWLPDLRTTPPEEGPAIAGLGEEPDPLLEDPAATLAAVAVHVEAAKGSIRVARVSGAVEDFSRGKILAPGDRLRVDEGAMLKLRVVGGGTLVADGSSELSFANSGDSRVRVELAHGRVLFQTAAGEAPYTIYTPHTRVWNVTTRFEVAVEPAGTTVSAAEGEAVLESVAPASAPIDSPRRVRVPAGNASRVAPGLAPTAPRPIDLETSFAWTDALATGRATVFEDRFDRPRSGMVHADAFASASRTEWAIPIAWLKDDPVEGMAARYGRGTLDGRPKALLALIAPEGGRALLASPNLPLVEGESYEVRARVRSEAEAAALAFFLIGHSDRAPAFFVRKSIRLAGPHWQTASLGFAVPLWAEPGTAWWAGFEIAGSSSPLEIGELAVDRIAYPVRREIDHDFARELPQGWQGVSGTWRTEGKRLVGSASPDKAALALLPPTAAYLGDYEATVLGSWDEGGLGVAFRIRGARDHYRMVASRVDGPDGVVLACALEAVEDGRTRILAGTRIPLGADAPPHHALTVRASGDGFEGAVDGRVVVRARDATFDAGPVGIVVVDARSARVSRVLVADY